MYKISPKDIISQEFKKVIRGYDPVEVDTFLEMIADEFGRLYKRNIELEEEVASSSDRMAELEEKNQQTEESVEDRDIGESEPESSKSPAAKPVVQADPDMELFERKKHAEQELQRIRDDIEIMKQRKAAFIKNLKKDLKAQIELLKVIESEIPADTTAKKKRKGVISQQPVAETKETGKKTAKLPGARTKREPDSRQAPKEEIQIPFSMPEEQVESVAENAAAETAPESKNPEMNHSEEADTSGTFHDGFNLIDNIIDEEEDKENEEN